MRQEMKIFILCTLPFLYITNAVTQTLYDDIGHIPENCLVEWAFTGLRASTDSEAETVFNANNYSGPDNQNVQVALNEEKADSMKPIICFQIDKHYLKSNYLLFMDDKFTSKTFFSYKTKKCLKEFVVGELCGVGFGLVAGVVGAALAPDDAGIGTLGYGLVGAYSGYALGTSVGVYIAGNDEQEKGSYIATLSGCIICTILGLKSFYLSDQKGFGSVALMLAPPI
ncbi:hypothetical protein H8E88_01385 [candidate division KSB1 bacterium]|nr:hypothetical protein [candidate division KSB1 bacterium]